MSNMSNPAPAPVTEKKNGLEIALEAIAANAALATEYLTDNDDRKALDEIKAKALEVAAEINMVLQSVAKLSDGSFKAHQATIGDLNTAILPFLAFAASEQLARMAIHAQDNGVEWHTDKLNGRIETTATAAEMAKLLRAMRPGKPSEGIEEGYYWGLLRTRVEEKKAENARLASAKDMRDKLAERNSRNQAALAKRLEASQEEVLETTFGRRDQRPQNGSRRNGNRR